MSHRYCSGRSSLIRFTYGNRGSNRNRNFEVVDVRDSLVGGERGGQAPPLLMGAGAHLAKLNQ